MRGLAGWVVVGLVMALSPGIAQELSLRGVEEPAEPGLAGYRTRSEILVKNSLIACNFPGCPYFGRQEGISDVILHIW